MNRWLETDTQKTARSIINVLNESAAGMVKKEVNKDKPEEAPKERKIALEKRTTKAVIKGKKPESRNAKMPEKTAKKIVKEELEPETGKSIEDQIADLQDYLDNTPEIAEDEKEAIQAEIDDLISQLGEKEVKDDALEEASFNDKVSAIKKSLKKKDRKLSDETAEQSAKNIAGTMAKKESIKEGYNIYKSYDELYGIGKYSPKELKKFIDGLKELNRISDNDYNLLVDFANKYQELIDSYEKEETKDDTLEEANYLSPTRKEEPLDLVAYKPEITSVDEVKDKYIKIKGDFHKVIDVKPEGDKFVISFAAGTGTAIGGEFEPATLDEIKRLQLYTENK